jgi:CDP-diacylglycerol--serine O-phosphatidyltransferase
VDAISFGLAPALIMYFAVLRHSGWDWVLVFLFCACAVMRLARFNVESAGKKTDYFKGLPSPAAGGTLATYYWFSQTPLYNETFVGNWPWEVIMRFLMVALAFLMISNVPYPAWPRFTFRTVHGAAAIVVFFASIFGLFFLPKEFFFPFGVLYVTLGVILAVARGIFELPSPFDDPDEAEGDGNPAAEVARP